MTQSDNDDPIFARTLDDVWHLVRYERPGVAIFACTGKPERDDDPENGPREFMHLPRGAARPSDRKYCEACLRALA